MANTVATKMPKSARVVHSSAETGLTRATSKLAGNSPRPPASQRWWRAITRKEQSFAPTRANHNRHWPPADTHRDKRRADRLVLRWCGICQARAIAWRPANRMCTIDGKTQSRRILDTGPTAIAEARRNTTHCGEQARRAQATDLRSGAETCADASSSLRQSERVQMHVCVCARTYLMVKWHGVLRHLLRI